MSVDNAAIAEAKRQLTICNSCRYCEGYCAVFHALGRRSVLADGDVGFLANLCHDCRGCEQACMFTTPHEFAMNLPLALADARMATYEAHAWPRRAAALFRRSTVVAGLSALVAFLVLAVISITTGDPARLSQVDTGAGSFYRVVPWIAMVLPATGLSLWAFAAFLAGGVLYWRDGPRPSARRLPRLAARALLQALTLRWMKGGGAGCFYPDADRPSPTRRRLHTVMLAGLGGTFASTTAAAINQELLGILPPYDYLSIPVVLGAAGGLAIIIGTSGLLALKARSRGDAPNPMTELDVSFLVVLDAASATGMILLALRGTAWLAPALLIHLASLAALYISAPYSKLAHGIYRYLAILQHAMEDAPDPPTQATSATRS